MFTYLSHLFMHYFESNHNTLNIALLYARYTVLSKNYYKLSLITHKAIIYTLRDVGECS